MTKKEKMDDRPVIVIQPDMLPISLEEYARRTSQSLSAVKSQHLRGAIPTLQVGKSSKVYVNQAQLIVSSLEAAGWDIQVPKSFYDLAKEEVARYA
ncbi:hypothetical protein [Vibrio sp. V39_P1S14PM300]|uniref:hypothetical protein n=1 Tax=Vibrio sp. V39_P1S14PM300 TaxID=1938690 RepID=UPI0013737145|nr:hypothetical protein [Vibrio sp. V39_P1S14PM300]NAX23802.1 hypothetical protein [Vibrio sp. V39_P1S14PM300]